MKNILVTGSTRGLGLEIATILAINNFKIITTGRKITKELDELMKRFPENVFFKAFDLSNQSDIHGFVTAIIKEHGNIYGLINNAAVGADGVLATMHDSDILRAINLNTASTILITKYCLRNMLIRKEGRVVNIASVIANTGFNGLSVYAATKSSLIGFTKSLSREVGKVNITVNAICPGYMKTDMTQSISDFNLERIKNRSPMKQLVGPEDVAGYVHYLLTPAAKLITGSVLTIDAGSTA